MQTRKVEVGKTSSSAALGTALAPEGLKTVVRSKDLARSLVDTLKQSVDEGGVIEVAGTERELYTAEERRGVGVRIAKKRV